MQAGTALSGFRCRGCGRTHDGLVDPRTCPDCGGSLRASYDYDAVSVTTEAAAGDLLERSRLGELLGVPATARPALGQGDTPLLDATGLASNLGVGSVAMKDEGRNPTGSLLDREMALSVGAAKAAGADTVALPTMGHGGQAAALAAARLGLDSQSFVPSRTPFVNKAMINVHDGDMTVVEGRYRDAEAAYRGATVDADWYPLAPVAMPFRVEGTKPLAYEIAAARDWSAPDWLVVPTGQVTGLLGVNRGFRDLEALGLVDRPPRLVAAQAAGCAPLAEPVADGRDAPVPVEYPDTVVGPLEIPEPDGGEAALAAIRDTDGTAVGSADSAILDAAQTLAESGLPASVTGGAALAAARTLAEQGEFESDDDLVLVNPIAGSKEADLMRSHLMSQGR